jgi:hypothetical protein
LYGWFLSAGFVAFETLTGQLVTLEQQMQFASWLKGYQAATFHHCHTASLVAMLVLFSQQNL